MPACVFSLFMGSHAEIWQDPDDVAAHRCRYDTDGVEELKSVRQRAELKATAGVLFFFQFLLSLPNK